MDSLSHPDRVRVCLELQSGEKEVACLRELLQISPSRLSQHLGLLKIQRLVAERKEGRKVFYHLVNPRLGNWLLESLAFMAAETSRLGTVAAALNDAVSAWQQAETPN